MSKLTDYSKFDHLGDDSDDEDEQQAEQQQAHLPRPLPAQTIASAASPLAASQHTTTRPPTSTTTTTTTDASTNATQRKDERTGRYVFEYNGNPVYEWEQKLEEVTMFVKPPPFVQKGNQIRCTIGAARLQLGLVGATNNQWFLNEETFGLVDVGESTWSLEDDEDGNTNSGQKKVICIYLIKAQKGVLWDAALKGNTAVTLDPAAQEQVRKDLLLERFQEENPGFDFQDAEFNGSVPEARTFMGGVKYS
jgi:hypothetical protein